MEIESPYEGNRVCMPQMLRNGPLLGNVTQSIISYLDSVTDLDHRWGRIQQIFNVSFTAGMTDVVETANELPGSHFLSFPKYIGDRCILRFEQHIPNTRGRG